MNEDDFPEDMPEELKNLLRTLSKLKDSGGATIKIVDMTAGKEVTPEGMLKSLKAAISGQKNTITGIQGGPATLAKAKDCLVINGSASFEAGTARSTRDPSKLAPVLECTIPFEEGEKSVMIEFEEPVGLLKLMEALSAMIIGYAFADKNEMAASLTTKALELKAAMQGKSDPDATLN